MVVPILQMRKERLRRSSLLPEYTHEHTARKLQRQEPGGVSLTGKPGFGRKEEENQEERRGEDRSEEEADGL